MRWFLLLSTAIAHASGQQTDAVFFVPNASTGLSEFTLSTRVPAFQQVILTPLNDTSVWVDACPAGAFSPNDALTCTACPAGTYSTVTTATGADTCVACESGKYSAVLGASSRSTCTDCPNGTYYEGIGGSSLAACLACPANSSSFQGSRLLQACVCLPGFQGKNGEACSACNTSVWCLFGQANPCPSNSISGPRSSSLAHCLCRPGYYGDATMGGPDLTLCQFCKENHFCPGGAVNATTVCPDGKYSLPGSDDPGDCNCPNNSVSRQNAMYVSECFCESGYYKEYSGFYPLGGWYCRLCQVGEFCFNNTNRTCPAFSTSFGVAKSFQDCFCNPGYKNTTVRTEQAFCEECPANSFCTGKGAVEACVPNALAPTQSQDSSRCYCDLGYAGVNNTPCVACQSPKFCYSGLEATCPEGTFSPPLAWDRLNCSCISGRWGPAGGPCILCSAGKYNLFPGCIACSNTTDLDCSLCELGTASSVLGRNTTCDVCAAGKYSFPVNTRGAISCEDCGIGRAAPAGSSNCTTCLSGWVAPLGASACTSCPAGTFAVAPASACTACPSGQFSLGGATACTNCSTCAIGQYNVSNCNASANIIYLYYKWISRPPIMFLVL